MTIPIALAPNSVRRSERVSLLRGSRSKMLVGLILGLIPDTTGLISLIHEAQKEDSAQIKTKRSGVNLELSADASHDGKLNEVSIPYVNNSMKANSLNYAFNVDNRQRFAAFTLEVGTTSVESAAKLMSKFVCKLLKREKRSKRISGQGLGVSG